MKLIFSFFALLLAFVSCESEYEGYKLIQVVPKNEDQIIFLKNIMAKSIGIDFWTEPSIGRKVDILLPPSQFTNITNRFNRLNLKSKIINHDIQQNINAEREEIEARRKFVVSQGNKAFDLDNFNKLVDIENWMDSLPQQCRPEINCEVNSIGMSVEGRPIKAFRIYKNEPGRKAYYIDGTTHAREWLSTATALKILDHLVRSDDSSALYLTETYDFYIIPVVNPDGYAFSWTRGNRFWRKNRSVNTFCNGVDINRNFGTWSWSKEGTSDYHCSEIYHGSGPNSEPETQAVANELLRVGPTLMAMVTLHSYGGLYLVPWGNTVDFKGGSCQHTDDHEQIMKVTHAAADATQYTYKINIWDRGNSCETINYATTGSTDEFAKDKANIKYNFCIELRGKSFEVPPSEIHPSFQETYNGIVAMNKAIELAESKH